MKLVPAAALAIGAYAANVPINKDGVQFAGVDAPPATSCASGFAVLPSVYTTQSCSQVPTDHNTVGSEMQCSDLTVTRPTPTCVTTAPICTSGEITHPPTYTTSKCAEASPDGHIVTQSCSTWVESFTFENGITPCIPFPTMHTRSVRDVAVEARATGPTHKLEDYPCGLFVPCPGQTKALLDGFFSKTEVEALEPTLTDRLMTPPWNILPTAPEPTLTERIMTPPWNNAPTAQEPALTDRLMTPPSNIVPTFGEPILTDRIITATAAYDPPNTPAPENSTDAPVVHKSTTRFGSFFATTFTKPIPLSEFTAVTLPSPWGVMPISIRTTPLPSTLKTVRKD